MEHTSPRFTVEYRCDDAAGVLRRDVGTLLPNGRTPTQTSGGAWFFDSVVARAGVYVYLAWDAAKKKFKEVRELVTDAVLEQWVLDGHPQAAPLTLTHPSRKKHPRGVTQDNHGALNTGNIGEEVSFVRHPRGGFVRATVCVRRGDAIKAVQSGTAKELSAGYRAILDHTPGVHPVYGPYDRQQVLRADCNHVAQVPAGRHGAAAAMKTDSADLTDEQRADLADLLAFLSDAGGSVQRRSTEADAADFAEAIAKPKPTPTTPSTEDAMNPFLLALAARLGVTRSDGQTDDQFAAAIVTAVNAKADAADSAARADADHTTAFDAEKTRADEATTRADTAEATVATEKARADTAEGARDTFKSQLDTLQQTVQDKADAETRTTLNAFIADRKLTIKLAEGIKADAAPVADLKRAIVAAWHKKDAADIADKSDAYIDATIDIIQATPKSDRYGGFKGKTSPKKPSTRNDDSGGGGEKTPSVLDSHNDAYERSFNKEA